MLQELQHALRAHASAGLPQSLEAYSLAVAIREVNPPLEALPRLIAALPELAVHARGSIRALEAHVRALA